MNGSFTVGSGPPPASSASPSAAGRARPDRIRRARLRHRAARRERQRGQRPRDPGRHVPDRDLRLLADPQLRAEGRQLRRGDRRGVDRPRHVARDVQPGRGVRVRVRSAPPPSCTASSGSARRPPPPPHLRRLRLRHLRHRRRHRHLRPLRHRLPHRRPPPPPPAGGTLYATVRSNATIDAAPRRRLAGDPGRARLVHDPGRRRDARRTTST